MDRIRRLADEHRRLLAAVCAALAVLSALSAVRQSPQTETILVARRDLASGTVVTADDIATAAVPRAAAPDHVLARHRALGRRVAGPMRAGEPLTDVRLVGPGSLDGYGADAVFTTIRVERADAAAIGAGDRVDVVAVAPGGESPAEIVARDVEVVTVPDDADQAEAAALGVVTTEQGALALAQAGLSSRLSVITSSD
ncbi:MAG: SAF domain-containing protein [Aeromicrobium sp.]